MSISVAVIGVGRWGINHVRVLSELRGAWVDSLYVVDTNAERAREVAERYRCDMWFASVDELLSRAKDLDAAVIAVPTVFHHRVASALAEKLDLLVEKPLAATPEEGLDIVRRAARAGRVLMVGHIERFNPVVHEAKYLARELGGPLAIEAKRVGPGPAREYTLNLGVAHDLLVHDIDVSNFILEELPQSVYSVAFTQEGFPYEVEVQALYRYPDGATSFLTASWRSEPHYKHRSLSIRTASATIRADYILRRLLVDSGTVRKRLAFTETSFHSESSFLEISYLQPEPLKLELQNFLDSVVGRAKPLVTGVDGYIALKCAVKALEASAKQQPVRIEWGELDAVN